jgi:hypothetical protein
LSAEITTRRRPRPRHRRGDQIVGFKPPAGKTELRRHRRSRGNAPSAVRDPAVVAVDAPCIPDDVLREGRFESIAMASIAGRRCRTIFSSIATVPYTACVGSPVSGEFSGAIAWYARKTYRQIHM